MTFYALQRWRASDANRLTNRFKRKSVDEPWNSGSGGGGTTLHNDAELYLDLDANITYSLKFVCMAIEAAGVGIDIKMAWTQPALCTFDMAGVAPHANWNATAANVEVEFRAWYNETGTTTATNTYGSNNSPTFSYVFEGSIVMGPSAGRLQFQWAQQNASASNLTIRSGSSLLAVPTSS